MKRISIAVTAVCLLAASLFTMQASAQVSFGARAGVNISNFKSDGEKEDAKTGIVLGGFASYAFSQKFSAQAELLYTQYGAKEGNGSYNFNYINVPLLAKYTIAQGFNVVTGPQIGFLASAKTKDGDGEKTDIKDLLKGSDISWIIGAGYAFNGGIGVDMRFIPGISDISDNSAAIKNTAFQLSLSYRFGGKK